MSRFKNLALTGALIATSVLTACTDRELAFGTGVVVGVIVGSDSNDHHHHHRPNPPRYRGRHYYRVTQNLEQLSPAERVSVKYGLSLSQSEVLVAHLLRAREGDLQAMAELGFERQDLINVFEGQNPSASTLKTLSAKLGLDLQQSHQLIQDIKADAILARENLM